MNQDDTHLMSDFAACRALVAPVVKGTEHLPDPLGPRRPILFVGEACSNHYLRPVCALILAIGTLTLGTSHNIRHMCLACA